LGGLGFGLLFVKVTTVTHAPGNWKTPCLQRQRISRGCDHIPHHGAPGQLGKTLVAGVVRQFQLFNRVTPYCLRQLQALF
jgi:hypothetical protein